MLMQEDPIMIWQQFLSMAAVCDLASFAIMCLELCLNQAGNERDFSDLKIKQTRLRNRLKIPRLEKMSKVRHHTPVLNNVCSSITGQC